MTASSYGPISMRVEQTTGQTKLIVERNSLYGTDDLPNTIAASMLRMSQRHLTRKSLPKMNLCVILSTTMAGCSTLSPPKCSLR